MSYIITAIISMIFGAALMACMAASGRGADQERHQEALKEAHRIGYQEGHHNGLRKGKVLKIDAALYEELKNRVYNALGNDSIREGNL